MKTKLLRKLRKEYSICSCTIDVIKTIYSVSPLNRYRNGDPQDAAWCSFSYENAVIKQRELILEHIKRL